MSEEKRIELLSKCSDIDCICQDCIYLQFVKNNILSNLQNQIEFLSKRENKLQQIEQMFQNGTVDLAELSELVKDK